jgi:hypothetical protein
MNPETIKLIAAQHHQSLRLEAARNRRLPARPRSRRLRRHPLDWHVSWSRTFLSAGPGQRHGSSLVIIISARRGVL